MKHWRIWLDVLLIIMLLALISPKTWASVTDGKFSLNQVFSTPNYDYWRSDAGFLGVNSAACVLNLEDCNRFTTGTLENPRDASNVNLGAAPYVTNLQPGEYIKFFNNGGGYSYGVFDAAGSLVNDLGAVSFEKITSNYIIFEVDNWYKQIVFTNELKTSGTDGGIISVPLGNGLSINDWNPVSIPAPVNPGFETGTVSPWTVSDNSGAANWNSGTGVSIVNGLNHTPGGGKTWTVTPYGTYMLSIQPGAGSPTFDSMTSSLGLTAEQNTAIKNMLTQQAQTGGGNPTPTNASWVKREVTLQAGVVYTYAWQYLSTDYTPFNDGSIMTLVHKTDAGRVPVLNNVQSNYALLGFTNPGTGNYSTNSYGSTGWQVATFVVPITGDYILGFAAFNLGDTILSPILLIDEMQGTTLLNNQPFAPVEPNAGSSAPAAPGPSLCCGGSAAPFSANAAFVTRQTNAAAAGDSKVIIDQIGNSNTISVTQSGAKNFADVGIVGSNNSTTINQTTTNPAAANYIELDIGGSSNTISLTQSGDTGNKGILATVNNDGNSLTINQNGAGAHYAEINLSGGNKTVNLTQSGTANHMAKIELSGGATSITATQSGSTQQSYSITHSCATASCAAITVTQGQ